MLTGLTNFFKVNEVGAKKEETPEQADSGLSRTRKRDDRLRYAERGDGKRSLFGTIEGTC